MLELPRRFGVALLAMAKPEKDEQLVHIGARVRERRRELDKTQEELAADAGFSKSFLSEVESGATPASGLIYLRLAQALDVTVQWLLTGAGEIEEGRPAAPVRIPQIVSELAEENGWTYSEAADIAAALDAIVARRTRAGARWEPTKEYVLRIAHALKGGNRS